ncbi:MAG TPA: helix-turn-helix transcriptional regulator [Gemmata sp.]|nr:helix-turn-helix transcriptional regulator [Gemmata sp.]
MLPDASPQFLGSPSRQAGCVLDRHRNRVKILLAFLRARRDRAKEKRFAMVKILLSLSNLLTPMDQENVPRKRLRHRRLTFSVGDGGVTVVGVGSAGFDRQDEFVFVRVRRLRHDQIGLQLLGFVFRGNNVMVKKKSKDATHSKVDRAYHRLLSPLSPSPICTLPLLEQLRRAISRSKLSLSELARRTGLDKGHLSRFINGKKDLTLAAADKIAQEINWPVEAPRYVILNVSNFRGQLCELGFDRHGVGGFDFWEAKKISQVRDWSSLAEEIVRCLGDND